MNKTSHLSQLEMHLKNLKVSWRRIFLLILAVAFSTASSIAQEANTQPSPADSMAAFCKDLPRPEYAKLDAVKIESDWFEAYTVADGVTAIYEPHQWQEVISYLIEGDKQALLFDSGNGIAKIAPVVAQLTDKPITVLNSHGHYDHVGGNYEFDEILGMQTLFTRARQTGHANADIAIELSDQALCKSPPAGVSSKNHIGRAYTITQFINDGHLIELGDRELEVIHLPGHTPDAIALLDKANGLMWTGDSYYSGPIWLFAPETNLQAYRASLLKLIENSKHAKFLLPAHNTPLVEPAVLNDVLIEFDAMLAGQLNKVNIDTGMVEYRSKRAMPFSFLMRDQDLPYTKFEKE